MLSLALIAVLPAQTVIAAPPTVTITVPADGEETEATPSFSGNAEEGAGQVALTIHAGANATGEVEQEWTTSVSAGAWSVGPVGPPLRNGTYTAVATQTNAASEKGESSPVTFHVDTPPPVVTLNMPQSPSTNTAPSFTGTGTGTTQVSVQIYAGTAVRGKAVSAATAAGTGGAWTSNKASPPLASGVYTAIASQEASIAGNRPGESQPVTFTVTAPAPSSNAPASTLSPLAPPAASFSWFPAVPQTGETVSLVSTSSDASSAITGLAWALTSGGPFQAGGPVLTTSFATPGAHVVRLRVTNANGNSSVATETINVVGPRALLMQPYPVVRLAGAETRRGIKLRLLQVQQLPAGARVTVRCRGRHCPLRFATRVAAASNKQRVAAIEFRPFERSLSAGITLEILVSAPGEIGKYTRFTVRRGRLPLRVDTCLDPSGTQPIACPAS
jgi:hypothetical protein